jgi:hypothetical protein
MFGRVFPFRFNPAGRRRFCDLAASENRIPAAQNGAKSWQAEALYW